MAIDLRTHSLPASISERRGVGRGFSPAGAAAKAAAYKAPLLLAVLLVLAPSIQGAAPVPLNDPAVSDGREPLNQLDPPSRVARLKYISGQVALRPASLEDWSAAEPNYPMTTGDHLWTDEDARAEVHLGTAVIRLAPQTAFSFLNLDDDVVQARVAEGTIDINVREFVGREGYEVDTPNAAISLLRPGIYRIDVQPDGELTRITVRSGLAQVDGNDTGFSVYAGDAAEVSGTDAASYDISAAWAPDAWERWCRDRDRREANRTAVRYVSSEMVGYEDLDDNGSWEYVPEYGWAWEPTVVAEDWAPYRYGHWAWMRTWGWTWVDTARWGFAPFHYGRWAHHHNRWIWVPGHYVTRPVWAPALVAFVGGSNWNFSFAVGMRPAIGWFPLGPGELYCPSYHVSPVYVRNINITHVNVTNVNVTTVNVAQLRYANREVPGAVTAVPREVFAASLAVQRRGVAVPRSAVDQTPIVGHAVAISPDARSARAVSSVAHPPAAASRRAVIARMEPPGDVVRTSPVVPLPAVRVRPSDRPVESGTRTEAADAPATRRATERTQPERADHNDRPSSMPTARGPAPYPVYSSDQGQNPQTAVPTSSRGSASERPGQRYERPAQSEERTSAHEERPVQRDERAATPRDERPAQREEHATPRYERPVQSEDRPARGREAESARDNPERGASHATPRNEEKSADRQAPSHAERPSTPAAQPAPSARPSEPSGNRPAQNGGGRGGRPRG